MYILRYLKVVVFNRRIYCSWSEIKLGKSIVYFSPICWGDSTFKRGCLFCFSITTSNMLEFTPYFFGHVGKTTKNRWALEVIFRVPWTFRVWISQWCRECGPQKETHLPTPVFFRCYFSSIIYGSGFCICSCFCQVSSNPIHQKSQRRWKRRRKTSNFHRCPKAEIGEIGEFLVRLIDRNWCKIQKDREILQVSQFQGFSCVVLLP